MDNKKLAFLLKLFVVILAALGLVFFGFCIPSLLHQLILFYHRTLNEELPLQLLSVTAAVILYLSLIHILSQRVVKTVNCSACPAT